MKLKQRSVFVKWLLSYLLILILMICCSISIYIYSYSTVKSQSVRINQMLLEKLGLEADNHLADIRGILENLILSREVQKVTAAVQTGARQQEDLLDLHRLILSQLASNKTISDIFIYLNNTDSVISTNGHMSSRQFYDLYYRDSGNSYEDFCSLMADKWKWEVLPLINTQGEKELVFLQTSLRLGTGSDSATVAVSVKESIVQEWFDSTKWDDSVEILALDEKNRMFGQTGALPEDTGLIYQQYLDAENATVEIGKTGYQLLRQDSEIYNWEYMLLIPTGLYAKSARRIQVFTMVDMLICLIAGSYAAYALTRAHYHPLKKIMELFGSRPMEDDKDEYRWLDMQTRRLISEKDKTAKGLRRYYLFKLVISGHEGASGRQPSYYGVNLRQPYNLVLLLIAEFETDYEAETQTVYNMSSFILENLFAELAEGAFHVECVDLGEELACIINLPEQEEDCREEIEAILDEVQIRVREWFHFGFIAFAGSLQKGVGGIHDSFLHASEAAEYKDTLNGEDIIWYEDIRNRSCVYDYPMETEQKLFNMILAGDEEGAVSLAGQVMQDNHDKKDAAAGGAMCLLYDLLGTVIRAAEAGGAAGCLDGHEIDAMFIKRSGRKQMEAELTGLVRNVSSHITALKQEKRNDGSFSRKVMEYVGDHYQDQDLNVSITAMAFDITPSYLSALFKEQTGTSLLEYINRTRIEKAKEMLSEGCSVAEAAKLSGFSNSSVFIRMFKKQTGITPGQMKKQVTPRQETTS